MPVIAIINMSIAAAIFSLLIMGVILNLKYTEDSVHKRYLIFTLMFWLLMLLSVEVKFCLEGTGEIVYNRDILSMRLLLLGIPSFLSLISLPIVILNANLLKIKNWVRVVSPIVIAVAVYFVWHYATGRDPFVRYASLEELVQNIGSVSLILRFALYLIFLAYVATFLICISRVVPLYNQYIHENIADSLYNVDWVRTFVRFIWVVTLFYFMVGVVNSRYVNCAYLISVLVMFGYLIEESLFHKTVEDVEPLIVSWSFKTGWYVVAVQGNSVREDSDGLRLERAWDDINYWMSSETPYTNVEFSIQDMLQPFADLTNYDLTTIFKSNGESFQTFVRNYRVSKACEIIKDCGGNITSKQLFGQVGFSHYSSFSRAFTAVLGISPSEYIQSERDRCANSAKSTSKIPPPPRRRVSH